MVSYHTHVSVIFIHNDSNVFVRCRDARFIKINQSFKKCNIRLSLSDREEIGHNI